jgi:thioredoxin-like negative regulator of GroEL
MKRPTLLSAFFVVQCAAAGIVAPSVGAGAAAEPAAGLWHTSARDAFAAAQRSGQPLLVDLYADWCGWCKVMEAKVFSRPEFARFAADYVLLRVDVEDGGEGSEVAARYGAESLPALLLVEPAGALVGEIRGYRPVDELVAEARAVREAWAKALASYERLLASSDAGALRAAAAEHYRRRDGERAARLFARLLAVDPSSGDDAAWLRFFLADSLRRAGRYEEALRAHAEGASLAARATDPELVERTALLPFWIAKDAARCAEASGALDRFERGHPESVYLPGARRALAELRSGRATCS